MHLKSILQTLFLTLAFIGALCGECGISEAADSGRPATQPFGHETESGYYYTVQKGDTLWDLSRRFSGTPWVWPELWEENNETIANPHLIYPGQKIRLTRLVGGRPASASASSLEQPVAGIHYYYSLCDQYGFIRRYRCPPRASSSSAGLRQKHAQRRRHHLFAAGSQRHFEQGPTHDDLSDF